MKNTKSLEDIVCDRRGCKVVIGYMKHTGREHWFDETHQVGHNSYCSDTCLRKEWRRNGGFLIKQI